MDLCDLGIVNWYIMRIAFFCNNKIVLVFVVVFAHIILQYEIYGRVKELYNINNTFKGTQYFNLHSIPTLRDIILEIFRTWQFHLRFSLIKTPRNFAFSNFSNGTPSNTISIGAYHWRFFCFESI